MPLDTIEKEDITLLELPFQKVSVKPGDVIVLMTDRAYSIDACQNILKSTKHVFPDNEILILEEGLQIGVVEKGEEDNQLFGKRIRM